MIWFGVAWYKTQHSNRDSIEEVDVDKRDCNLKDRVSQVTSFINSYLVVNEMHHSTCHLPRDIQAREVLVNIERSDVAPCTT